MDQLIQADVFFFITAIATVILTVLIAVGLVYLIRILKDVRKITTRVSDETEVVAKDINALRSCIKQEGWKLGILRDISRFFSKRRPRKGRESSINDEK